MWSESYFLNLYYPCIIIKYCVWFQNYLNSTDVLQSTVIFQFTISNNMQPLQIYRMWTKSLEYPLESSDLFCLVVSFLESESSTAMSNQSYSMAQRPGAQPRQTETSSRHSWTNACLTSSTSGSLKSSQMKTCGAKQAKSRLKSTSRRENGDG